MSLLKILCSYFEVLFSLSLLFLKKKSLLLLAFHKKGLTLLADKKRKWTEGWRFKM